MIIDFEKINAERFIEWAGNYLDFPYIEENKELMVCACVEVLIENGIFTVLELKTALSRNGIMLHERYFKGV